MFHQSSPEATAISTKKMPPIVPAVIEPSGGVSTAASSKDIAAPFSGSILALSEPPTGWGCDDCAVSVRRSQVPPHLYARYGINPRPRWAVTALAVVGLALAAGLLGWISRGLGSGGEVRLISWESTARSAQIEWSITRYDDAAVYCVLHAQDRERYDVGFAVLRITHTAASPRFSSQLNLRGSAYAVDTPQCETDPAHLISPHFRPGWLPPAQQSPLFAPWQPATAWQ